MGRGKLKWCQLAHSQQRFILVHTVNLKPIIKDQISGKLVTSSISDLMIISVHSEKTRLNKMIMIYYYYNRKTIY